MKEKIKDFIKYNRYEIVGYSIVALSIIAGIGLACWIYPYAKLLISLM